MSLIRKPSELELPKTTKALLYGQPGIGKTTLALSAPRPILLDFDRGVHRVLPQHQTPTVQISKWEDVQEVLQDPSLKGFGTLAIDTAGKMLDFMTDYLIRTNPKLGKTDGSLQIQGYGARKVMFTNFLSAVSMLGLHLVFVAHDVEEKDGEQKIIRPLIGGSSGGDLIRELDLVGYVQAIGSKRTVSFDPCERFYGKNVVGLDPVINIPDSTSTPNELMSIIIKRSNDAKAEHKRMSDEFNELVSLIESNVEDIVVDASTANDTIDWIMALDHIWNSRDIASRKLSEKTKKLGLMLDTKEKRYYSKKEVNNEPA